MNIHISTNNYTTTPDIQTAIEYHIQKLSHIVEPLAVSIYVHQNTHHKKGSIYTIEVDYHVPKKIIHAQVKNASNVRGALDVLEEKLERQIKKYKDKPRITIHRIRYWNEKR